MAFLHTLQTNLLRYNSPVTSDQEEYFSCARNLVVAQFQLADQELTKRLWQDVADRNLDVDRIENLMYRCFFQSDKDASFDFVAKAMASVQSVGITKIGIVTTGYGN